MSRAAGWLKQNGLLVLLFAVGAAVRLIYAGGIPGGLNQDEASIGYEAYSLLHYGVDRSGHSYPVHLVAWGSGQNALYAYLSMPFIYLFGLNVVSVRAVSLVFGIISIALFYGIALQLFKKKHAALTAVFLLAICPWHIMMSRWALESNIFPTLVLLAVYLLLKSLRRPGLLAGFTVAMAVSLYAYGTAYFFVPVFVTGAAIILAVQKAFPLRTLAWNGALGLALSAPIGLFLIVNRWGRSSVDALLFTVPKLTVPRVERVSTVFGGDSASMLAGNFKSFLLLFVTQTDGLPWNAVPAYGYLYPVAFPLIAVGLAAGCASLSRRFTIEKAILAWWFITAVAMTFITDVNMNRVNIVFYPTILAASGGLLWLCQKMRFAFAGIAAVLAVCFVSFCSYYFTDYARQIGPLFYESFGEAARYASDGTDGRVYVTDQVNMPYIYVLFYERTDPRQFLSTVEYANPGAEFQQVRSFGRYVFEEPRIREGEEAAYIFPNGAPLPAAGPGFEIKSFKHYTVVIADGDASK